MIRVAATGAAALAGLAQVLDLLGVEALADSRGAGKSALDASEDAELLVKVR
jgi:hypothetical protein